MELKRSKYVLSPLTVKELKEFLSDLPDNAGVFILDRDDIVGSTLYICDIESGSITGYYDYLHLNVKG